MSVTANKIREEIAAKMRGSKKLRRDFLEQQLRSIEAKLEHDPFASAKVHFEIGELLDDRATASEHFVKAAELFAMAGEFSREYSAWLEYGRCLLVQADRSEASGGVYDAEKYKQIAEVFYSSGIRAREIGGLLRWSASPAFRVAVLCAIIAGDTEFASMAAKDAKRDDFYLESHFFSNLAEGEFVNHLEYEIIAYSRIASQPEEKILLPKILALCGKIKQETSGLLP
jgi:hypothetical protein